MVNAVNGALAVIPLPGPGIMGPLMIVYGGVIWRMAPTLLRRDVERRIRRGRPSDSGWARFDRAYQEFSVRLGSILFVGLGVVVTLIAIVRG